MNGIFITAKVVCIQRGLLGPFSVTLSLNSKFLIAENVYLLT